MRAALPRPNRPRRGVTLVEMLVVVALVVLMMTILVQIFQQATGAMSASRAVAELDVSLRQIDLRLRQDLAGVTARMTPPLDPTLKLGYFEYGENAFADAQGEDTDDYLAFTTKAPEGQVFTGRANILGVVIAGQGNSSGNRAIQPVTITSQLAEVVYFLRNGNLYRRVFLIVPERNGTIGGGLANPFPAISNNPAVSMSWIGVNDVSVRPNTSVSSTVPITNDLGYLTNREYRALRPRYSETFYNVGQSVSSGSLVRNDDGIADDFNADGIPDFYPTLYPNLFAQGATNPGLVHEQQTFAFPIRTAADTTNYDVLAFPYIYPGMYSKPETATPTNSPYSLGTGWIHSLDPSHTSYPSFATGNHAPLARGDNLPFPNPNPTGTQAQTWWGFPTWRETLASNWRDPIQGLGVGGASGSRITQALGLQPFDPTVIPSTTSTTFLPPVLGQFANDNAGSATFGQFINAPGVWDDDLVLTNVRSFDVKAYDSDAGLYSTAAGYNSAGYYDLGYGLQTNPAFRNSSPELQGFGHAGRIPPLTTDNRLNPSRPYNLNATSNNVGDDAANVIRLTRVWDTWSTDYTNAPDVDVNLNGNPSSATQPLPIYPSYPPPYAAALRGIQIQIRVADPRNERVKVLTIRQDFTDKL